MYQLIFSYFFCIYYLFYHDVTTFSILSLLPLNDVTTPTSLLPLNDVATHGINNTYIKFRVSSRLLLNLVSSNILLSTSVMANMTSLLTQKVSLLYWYLINPPIYPIPPANYPPCWRIRLPVTPPLYIQ